MTRKLNSMYVTVH